MVAIIDPDKCNGYTLCADACPVDAITIREDDIAIVDPDICTDCGECVDACPVGAITIK
ncbi:4Fe-4S ferredoxin iron-sulfur binding domain protein [Methanosalsum zhilinae DSM 4017]|uniref:Ferredoxin n=1 Tax=Methanosalsum zhilinae (strain DSM 4017 / NBRC 107636 / OCM 62 / WeN5) TaxID=679901 RepID=F7XND3_METZD|nr:4Fe-4S binding protein [Methanosalsum zhilinae]AEH61183.1 4Fe-4S ferredoxin iron-sulfur binding domain protein [Methanosalsum zhilinae DSM 4017]